MCTSGRKLAVYGDVSGVGASLLGSHLARQSGLVWDASLEMLTGQDRGLALGDVETTEVLGCADNSVLAAMRRALWLEMPVQASWAMRSQVVRK